MEFLILPLAAFLASLLTFFSGFGLGTILLPVFALWFPVELSVALTAVVHFFNNAFKLVLVGRHAHRGVVLRFGLPAVLAAFVGAAILLRLAEWPHLYQYSLSGRTYSVTPVKLVIATLMVVFTLFEVIPKLKRLEVNRRYLPFGGLLSGFFGGLSGHQGALRSAFLVRAGLGKEAFVATGVVIACLVDLARLGLYSRPIVQNGLGEGLAVTVTATLAAFAGAFAGSRLLKKITMDLVQKIVTVGLFLLAVALGSGWI